jgi:hypothetical protein
MLQIVHGGGGGACSLDNLSYALTDTRCYCQYEIVVWTSDIIARHGVEQFSIHRGFTNFPQNEEPPQDSMRQNGDVEEVVHWGATNISRHRIKFSRPGDLEPGICAHLIEG